MKIIIPIVAAILGFAYSSMAANSVISFTDLNYATYAKQQTETANPLLTQLVTDNNSHTITLSSIGTYQNPPIAFSLRFNGTNSACIVRLMNTATKASWIAYPVAAGGIFGQGIHPNTLFINYSSCFN